MSSNILALAEFCVTVPLGKVHLQWEDFKRCCRSQTMLPVAILIGNNILAISKQVSIITCSLKASRAASPALSVDRRESCKGERNALSPFSAEDSSLSSEEGFENATALPESALNFSETQKMFIEAR